MNNVIFKHLTLMTIFTLDQILLYLYRKYIYTSFCHISLIFDFYCYTGAKLKK